MKERKLWTKEEDDALMFLIQKEKIDKWCDIAKRMRQKFGKNSRNQKQCRDRYVNHLRLKKEKIDWKKQDEEKIIDLHKELGNKWVAIAQHFDGVTQIFIKNQFYSRLRKSIRKINKYINESFRKQFKEFKLNVIFKLASVADGKLKKLNEIHPLLNEYYSKFLYILISFASDSVTMDLSDAGLEENFISMLVKPLVSFERIFSLLNKKRRRRLNSMNSKKDSCMDQSQEENASFQSNFQSQWDSKIIEISHIALKELEELIKFDENNLVLRHDIENGEKSIQVDLKRQNCKQKKNKKKSSVSQFSESHCQKSEKQIICEEEMQEIFQPMENQKCMSEEGATSVIEEESLVIDILYEQDSRSMMFIDDGWANDSECDLIDWEG